MTLAAGGANAASHGMMPTRRMAMRHPGGHGVRARRFPRKTQAGASIGKADRASSGGRGSNVSRSGSPRGSAARRRRRAGRGYMLPFGGRSVCADRVPPEWLVNLEHFAHEMLHFSRAGRDSAATPPCSGVARNSPAAYSSGGGVKPAGRKQDWPADTFKRKTL